MRSSLQYTVPLSVIMTREEIPHKVQLSDLKTPVNQAFDPGLYLFKALQSTWITYYMDFSDAESLSSIAIWSQAHNSPPFSVLLYLVYYPIIVP